MNIRKSVVVLGFNNLASQKCILLGHNFKLISTKPALDI